MKFEYSFLKIFSASDLAARRLPLMEAESGNPGPVVWLTACIHGDEVGGMVVVQEIFKRLRKNPLLKGSLKAFPLLNPFGFESTSREIALSEEDLNRSFPGKKEGSLAEMIAHKIFTKIKETKPSLILDLHNDRIDSIPHALLDPESSAANPKVYGEACEISLKTGLLVVREREEDSVEERMERSLSSVCLQQGVPAMTLELGEPYVVNEKDIVDGVRAIWNVLAFFQMVNPINEPFNYSPPEEFKGRVLTYYHQHVSSTAGITRYLAKPGDVVRRGQPIARVYNVFGKHQETIVAKYDGIVLDHTESSAALPGVPMMAFGVETGGDRMMGGEGR